MIYKLKKMIIEKFFNVFHTWLMSKHYCHGDPKRLHLGKSVSTVNTLFNLASGCIHIGDNTIFGHNCLVLTGTHRFNHGRRFSLKNEKNNDEIDIEFDESDQISINELSNITQYSLDYLRILIKNDQIPNHNNKFFKKQILEWMNTKETPILGRDIIVGSGCFIGSGSIINGDVSIGNNTIICSGSVVTKNIPSNVIAGGVPAIVIRNH